jgi:hypothetical protein
MQVTDVNGNIYGFLGLEITGPDGKPKVPSGSTALSYRHDFNVYDYLGTAPNGSLDASNVWDITRLTIASDGSVTSGVATGVSWTGRYTHTYL